MVQEAFQDFYPDQSSHCFGCGRLNHHGLQIKSYWDGDESVAVFMPEPFHIGFPGYVYGGLIASLMDCHAIGTAAAATARSEGNDLSPSEPLGFVTASLNVNYLKPTPIGHPLTLRGTVTDLGERKVCVDVELSVNDLVCARGKVVAVKMPSAMMADAQG